jgi:hypothetical protein
MAENENTTANQPEQEEPESPETEQAADSPAESDRVPESVATSIDTLAKQVREEREAANRGRMTTITVFIILIAVIVGYMGYLRYRIDQQLNAKSLVNLGLQVGTQVFAENVGVDPENRTWNEVAVIALDRKMEQWSDQMIRELPEHEDEIKERLASGIDTSSERVVDLLVDRALPELRRTSIDRIEGEVTNVIRHAEPQIEEAVTQIIERNKENLRDIGDEQELQVAIRDAFKERLQTHRRPPGRRRREHGSACQQGR